MSSFKMKMKFLLMALVPMTVVLFIVLTMVVVDFIDTLDRDVQEYKKVLLEERKSKVQDSVLIAKSVIDSIVTENGNGERGAELVRQALGDTRFEDGSGYFFVFDGNLNYVLHGAKPSANGSSGGHYIDSNGVKFVQEMQSQALSGGGFVNYIYDKPGSSSPQPKLAYAAPIAGSQWFVGTGLYIDDIENSAEIYRKEAKSVLVSHIRNIVLVSLLVLVITSFVIVYFAKRATKPVEDILATVEDISNGEGDLTQRIEVQGKDEIAQLGRAFNRFIEQLHRIISDVAVSTDKVSHVTDILNVQSADINAQLQEHNLETEQVATAVTEMSTTAMQVAENANQVSYSTDEAHKESQVAQSIVDRSSQAVDSLEQNLDQTSVHMNSLSEQSKKIDSVLQVIGEIAEQTNLLALNAAIEAARAGEQGRGFAVVADEVRSLASRTQGSTSEIKLMLDELHHLVSQAVNSMGESSETCKTVVSSSADISSGLSTVSTAVDSINDMTAQIATAATEQSQVTDEINQNLVKVQDIVVALVASSDESNAATSELKEAGDQLSQLVAQFKL